MILCKASIFSLSSATLLCPITVDCSPPYGALWLPFILTFSLISVLVRPVANEKKTARSTELRRLSDITGTPRICGNLNGTPQLLVDQLRGETQKLCSADTRPSKVGLVLASMSPRNRFYRSQVRSGIRYIYPSSSDLNRCFQTPNLRHSVISVGRQVHSNATGFKERKVWAPAESANWNVFWLKKN
jgi:hypothetical protein